MKNNLSGWYIASILPPVDETINDKYRYRGWMLCIDWCKETFGEMTMDNYVWRFIGEGVFEFRDEKMLLMFLLRWA
jgi:hypothetical protein